MTILKFVGVVKSDALIENDETGSYVYTPSIGGVDIIDAIEAKTFSGPVTVAIADERFDGVLHTYTASPGYSEWTPAEPAELTVGPHNIIEILARHEGEVITLWIVDEPFNVLE